MFHLRPLAGKVAPIALAGLLVVAAPVTAQTAGAAPQQFAPAISNPASTTLTLPEAISLALSKNAELSVIRREWEATRGAVIQAGVRPNPELSVQQEDFRRGMQTTTIQVTQPLELGGKRAARTAVAERVRDQAAADVEQSRADIRALVVTSFYETLVAQERLRLAQESLQLAVGGADATSKRVQAGKIAPLEETRARVAQAAAQAELAQAEGGLRSAKQRLFSLWGETRSAPAVLVSSLELPGDGLPDEVVFARMTDSPVLKRARLELDRARAALELEQARRVVDVGVSFGAKRAQETGVTAAVVGITVPIPLFDRNQGNIAEALSREEKARDELTATELRLSAEIAQLREQLRSARAEASTLQRDAVPGAKSAYAAASQGFQLGKFSYLEALDAQRTLVSTQSQYLRALLDTYRAAAELERLLSISDASSALLNPIKP